MLRCISKMYFCPQTSMLPVERVIERGNDEEKAEIKRFYGEKPFCKIADDLGNTTPPQTLTPL